MEVDGLEFEDCEDKDTGGSCTEFCISPYFCSLQGLNPGSLTYAQFLLSLGVDERHAKGSSRTR